MGSACRTRFTPSGAEVLRGKRVKSAFFETCGQPPEKEEKTQKLGFLKEALLTIVRLKNF